MAVPKPVMAYSVHTPLKHLRNVASCGLNQNIRTHPHMCFLRSTTFPTDGETFYRQIFSVSKGRLLCSRSSLSVVSDNTYFDFDRKKVTSNKFRRKVHISSEKKWDVLGLGQAMVDFAAAVDDSFLEQLQLDELEKGGRKCISDEERAGVLAILEGKDYKLSAGGSLSNTLVAISRMSKYATRHPGATMPYGRQSLSVSVACSLGSDPLGEFYRNKLGRAGVQVLSPAAENGTTGSVVVLTTPDANRTMLSYQGTSASMDYTPTLDANVSGAGVLVVEGYLWEMPETINCIKKALATARKSGTKVALTASDASCVERHGTEFWSLLEDGSIDVLFANESEALAMCAIKGIDVANAPAAVDYLSQYCRLVAVTAGHHGSYLRRNKQTAHVLPFWTEKPPVDTCGAGDAYAAGVLYGLVSGAELEEMGQMGSRVASAVISHTGARFTVGDAEELSKERLFNRPYSSAPVKQLDCSENSLDDVYS